MNSSLQYEHLKYQFPSFQQGLAPMPNIGTNMYRQPYHNVYEDWWRYKNALPLDSSHLLPLEQLRPPEEYIYPPPPVLSDLYRVQYMESMQEERSRMENATPIQSHRESPSVRVHSENSSAYYNKFGTTNSLPRFKAMSPKLQPKETNHEANTKSTETENE